MALTCGFIGLGLIGGSIAKAFKENIPDVRIVAYDINRATLHAAFSEGVADQITDQIDASFSSCDYIFLCAPVQKNDANLEAVTRVISTGCILTDVGSVKTDIHNHIAGTPLESRFIGGHPMAGSERTGYVNSRALLLQNAYYILTPTDSVPAGQVTRFRDLVQKLGAIPLILSFAQHDYVTAAVSHLPHVIAASLVNLVRNSDSEDGIMKMIAAGGFKDITRIASSSAAMWQQICLTNTDNILTLLDSYIASLNAIRSQLAHKKGKELYDLFDNARIYRDSFINAPSGPIKKAYSLNVDIADEPGALAAIATILALSQISIKNIGITHNREMEDGVLRIEFYEEADVQKARSILVARGYTIYEKK